MISKKIDVKVFLEGIEIPFNSIQLTMQPNAMGVLEITVPPLKRLFDIVPRTLVHVYFNDGGGFRLFFEGEVLGHGFAKSPQGRGMTLTCGDLSNYWMYSYAFYLTLANIENYSLEDEVQLFTGVDSANISNRKDGQRVFPIRAIAEKFTQLLVRKDRDVVASIREIFKLVSDVNEFYKDRFTKLKLNERLFSMPDSQIQFLLPVTVAETMKSLMNNQPRLTPILQALSILLQSIYQNFWSLSLPSVKTSGTGQVTAPANFEIVPANFLTAPPRCNVIFPDLHEGFNYSRNFMAEPTRFDLVAASSDDGLVKQYYLAPAEFRALVKDIKKSQQENIDKRTQNLIIHSDNPELDEASKGPVPATEMLSLDTFSQIRNAAFKASKDPHKAIETVLQNVADFEYLLRKFSSRGFPVEMPFNANIHPAFPVLLLDSEGRLFGSPMVLTHLISGDGQAKTILQCRYARHKDVLGDVIETPPPWLNKSFDPAAIGEDSFGFTDADGTQKSVAGAYPTWMPGGGDDNVATMRSIMSQDLPIFVNGQQNDTKKPATQEEAANALYDLYLNSGDREAFINEYTRRRIMTMAEHLSFLGITQTNDDQLDGTIFDPNKRLVIEDVKAALVEAGNAFREI